MKVIRDAFWKIAEKWQKSFNREEVEAILLEVYNAGLLDAADQDAACWRMFEHEFGGMRARLHSYYIIPPRFPYPFPADEIREATVHVQQGTRWRLECGWNDPTGAASTLPKFITWLLEKRKQEAEEAK